MTITPEEAIKWHEQRAAEAHAGLSCGSENSEYRAADKVSEMHRMAARALAENERLREIISRCAASLGNGAAIMPTCTVEFMAELPREIELVTSGLRSELSTAYRRGREDMREEAAKVASRMLVFADTTSSADKEIPAAIRRLAEQEAPEAAAIRKLEA